MVKLIVLRIIEAKYSISSWLWAFVSTATGLVFAAAIKDGTGEGLDDFLKVLPVIDPLLWASLIAVTGVVLMLGMLIDSDIMVGISAFTSFVLWVFGALAFVLLGSVATLVILIIPFLLFFAYIFVATFVRDNNRK